MKLVSALVVASLLTVACGSESDGGGPSSSGGAAGSSAGSGGSGGATAGSGGTAGVGGNAGVGGSAGAAGSGGGGGVPGPFPGADWTTKDPSDVGLDAAKLDAFSSSISGRGVVVRGGYLAYSWGNASQKGDIASAAKTIYGFFLFKAVQKGMLSSIDDKATKYVPELATLNGGVDAAISFRHFATQTSCYGVSEAPGAAFDYNDFQMALFWDTLFLDVWGATYDNVDANVLAPELCDVIGCQDQPTFLAFGKNDRAGRVAISPRDFARFGLLYLRGGTWDGTELLPSAVVSQIVQSPLPNSIPQTTGVAADMLPGQRTIGSTTIPDNQTDHLGSYSFMWWINGVDRNANKLLPDAPDDTFMASGHGAKRAVVVIPSLDLIVSWNDTNISDWNGANQALKALLAAVTP